MNDWLKIWNPELDNKQEFKLEDIKFKQTKYIPSIISALKIFIKIEEKEIWKFDKNYITNKYVKKVLKKYKNDKSRRN